jgi:E2/UBC family protein E
MQTENAELQADVRRLAETTGRHVDLIADGAQIGIVVRGVELPQGSYDPYRCDILLRTDTQYPLSAMDMFWVSPRLRLADGREPAGTSEESAFGETWLRFSWHRNSAWVPGRDDLVSHFDFALARLLRPE